MSRRDIRLWLLILAGPAAWAIDFNVSYAVSPNAHDHESVLDLYLLHAGAFVIAAIAAVLSGRLLRSALQVEGDVMVQRTRFMAAAGLGLSVISLLLIAGIAIPTFMLPPGAEP